MIDIDDHINILNLTLNYKIKHEEYLKILK
jgi:hypothetical protein